MAKALESMHETTIRDRAVIDLQKEILTALSAQSALMESEAELKNEVARLKAWDADKQRYKLTELRPGIVAYSIKETMENGEPQHKLCTACYQVGFKSFLTQETWNPGRCNVMMCVMVAAGIPI